MCSFYDSLIEIKINTNKYKNINIFNNFIIRFKYNAQNLTDNIV